MSRRRSGYIDQKYSGKYLGPRIKDARISKGISIQKLADQIGVLGNYVSQLENGDKMPSIDTFIRIANALNVTADELLCDYLIAENKVVNCKVNADISSLDKVQQRHIEELVALEIKFLQENNHPYGGRHDS